MLLGFQKVEIIMFAKKHFFFILLFIFLYGSFALLGCVSAQATTPQEVQEVTSTVTAVSQILAPASTFDGPTGSPTQTSLPPPSGLPPTWTPLPKYSLEQANQIVMELYENNPCTLPCWWGITPGKTDWREAWQFLERFAANQPPWDNLLLESKDLPGYMSFQVFLNVPQTTEEKYYLSLNHLVFLINIDTFVVDYIDVNTGNIDAYTIPQILANFGKPQEIYVMIGESQVPQFRGVSVLLFYPQHGFISNHFTTVDQEQLSKPKFTACFQKVTNLYLWPQEQNLDIEERLRIGGVDPLTLSLLRPINQVSDLSIESFYQTYVNLREPPCIEFSMPSEK